MVLHLNDGLQEAFAFMIGIFTCFGELSFTFMLLLSWLFILGMLCLFLCSPVPYRHVIFLWYLSSCFYLAYISMYHFVVLNFHGCISLVLSTWACAVLCLYYLALVDSCLCIHVLDCCSLLPWLYELGFVIKSLYCFDTFIILLLLIFALCIHMLTWYPC